MSTADRTYVRAWLGYLFADAVDLPAFVRWSWWHDGRGPDTAGAPVADLDAAADAMVALSNRGAAVYLRQTLTSTPPAHKGERGGKLDTAFVTHLWADLDVDGPTHKPKTLPLPPTAEVAEMLADEVALMTAVLDSGGGLYGVWKLTEPIDVRDPARRAEVERLAERFDYALVAAGERHGYHVDKTLNLDRILRPAGVMSYKAKRPYVPMVTVRRGWAMGADPYDFGELAACGIDPAPKPARSGEGVAVRSNRPRSSDDVNVLDLINETWTLRDVLTADRTFGPWDQPDKLDDHPEFEHWLRAGSSSTYSVKRNRSTGVVIVWSDEVASHLGCAAGEGLTLADFAARLFGVSLSELSTLVLRRARQLREVA